MPSEVTMLIVIGLSAGAALIVFVIVATVDFLKPADFDAIARSKKHVEVGSFLNAYPNANVTIPFRDCIGTCLPDPYDHVTYSFWAQDRMNEAYLIVTMPKPNFDFGDVQLPQFRIGCSSIGNEVDSAELNGTRIDVTSFLNDERCPK